MNAHVRVWLTDANHDIRMYRTTVTLTTPSVTTAITLFGKRTRKEALTAVFCQLVKEEGRWSPSFLAEVKALAIGRRGRQR